MRSEARGAYIDSLKTFFESTKGLIIKVPASLEQFKKAQPEHAPLVMSLMVDKGLLYPTTYQRTQIRGDIDSIYNELSRAERWGLGKDLPEDFNPLWQELCALFKE